MATISAYATAAGKRYRVRYRKPNGQQTDKRGFTTKRDASLFLATVEVDKAFGTYIDPSRSRESIGSLGRGWLDSRTDLKPASKAAYESAWRVHIEPQWGARQIGTVEHAELRGWLTRLSTGDTVAGAKPRSAALVHRCYDILAGVFDAAVRDRRISMNPVRGVALPRKVKRERRYLTHAEVAKLLAATPASHRAVVAVLAFTGIRFGEASALRARDVDLKRRRLDIRQNAVRVNGKIEVGTPKGHDAREVSYPAALDTPMTQAMKGKIGDALVFPNQSGSYRRTPTAETDSWWDAALNSAGIAYMTVHDLRHTAVSFAISAGANVKVVQRMVGHKSAAMTLDEYADLFDADLDSVSTAVNARIPASVGKLWADVA